MTATKVQSASLVRELKFNVRKQSVETIPPFDQNDASFDTKRHIDLIETTCRFSQPLSTNLQTGISH